MTYNMLIYKEKGACAPLCERNTIFFYINQHVRAISSIHFLTLSDFFMRSAPNGTASWQRHLAMLATFAAIGRLGNSFQPLYCWELEACKL